MEAFLKQHLILRVLFILFIFIGCESNKADLIIENGIIYTMDDFNPIAVMIFAFIFLSLYYF